MREVYAPLITIKDRVYSDIQRAERTVMISSTVSSRPVVVQ